MKNTDTLIIGGGQAGLAMSRCLAERSIDHVVLERGRIGERWRSERWDSSRLLTPRWQSRLPFWHYRGSDPDGYMTTPELVGYLERYARSFRAPIETNTTVLAVEQTASGYHVATDRGSWSTPNVVVATGHCDVPFVPELARRLSPHVLQLVPTRYRNPGSLPSGGVLIVGASASGVQIADELARSGRAVTLAVGRHVRVPRCYRGRDILWWLDLMGVCLQRTTDFADERAIRGGPSLQLAGRPDHRTLDLAALQAAGVRLTGRATEVDGYRVRCADDLEATTAEADRELGRLLARIDDFARTLGLDGKLVAPESIPPFRPRRAPTRIDLRAEGITTVIWATGFRRRYPWLAVPVLDGDGELRHRGGVTPAPGFFVLGLRFLRRRNSSLIDGVGNDAEELSRHVATRLGGRAA